MISAARLVALATIFFIPLLGPVGNFGYEQTKVIFFAVATIICCLLLIINILLHPKDLKLKTSRIKLAATVFLITLLITSVTGVDLNASFFGREPYYQGFVIYFSLFLFFLILTATKVSFYEIAVVLTASSAAVALVAIGDFISVHYFAKGVSTYAGRVVSTFGQPNFYSGFLLLVQPFLYYLITKSKGKLKMTFLAVLLIDIAAIIISQSRAAIFLLFFLVVGWLITRLSKNLQTFMTILAIGVILGSTAISIYTLSGLVWEELGKPWRSLWFLHEFPDRGFFFWQLNWTNMVEKRIFIWPVIGDLILKRPFLGYGLENILPTFATSTLAQFHGIKDLTVDRSHSYLLDLLYFSGILGLLGWIWLVWEMIKSARSKLLLVCIVLYLAWINFQLLSVVHLLYFWLLVYPIDNQEKLQVS